MKSLNLSFNIVLNFIYRYPLFLMILFVSAILIYGLNLILSVKNREIKLKLEETTKDITSVWQAVTSAHAETMQSYFMHYVMNPKTLKILKRANSKDEREQNLARAELFKHLWYDYKYLRDHQIVRQFHFHLPNNRSFLRFHAPTSYGDDLTPYRPTVVLTNKLKKPHLGFETGRVITGYRYVYPIIDKEGNHLGSVEISRPFEILRKALKNIYQKKEFLLIIREEDVLPKLLPEYFKYYIPAQFAKGWVLEDPLGELPDSPQPMEEEYQKVLNAQGENREFLKMLEDSSDGSIVVSYDGKHYIITAIKLRELDKNKPSAILLAITRSEEIDLINEIFKRNSVIFTLLILALSIISYLYTKQTFKIRQKQEELDAITSSMGSGLIVIDKRGIIKFVNEPTLRILGYKKNELIGSVAHYKIHVHESTLEDCPLFKAISMGRHYGSDEVFRKKDGTSVDVHVVSRPLFIHGDHIGAVIVFTDITDRKRMEKELYTLSITDALTTLYNRRFQLEMLKNAKNKADRYGEPFSLLMIDIDNFKSINDNYGHEMGDVVLKKLAEIFLNNIRATDVASRWGGEEFLILLPNTNLDNALLIAERIRRQVEALKIDNLSKITVSIGVTAYNGNENINELISRADMALYEAKTSGKNTVRFLKA
ncbi:MAG: diguanylate cyclase [Thermodesulfobacteriaceae bacterium]|nr:diguanylate cyclase [Thermodesulfobacteriaceae bacterium]